LAGMIISILLGLFITEDLGRGTFTLVIFSPIDKRLTIKLRGAAASCRVPLERRVMQICNHLFFKYCSIACLCLAT
jgi:hypothetical protein